MTPVTRLPLIYGGGPTTQADPRMSPLAQEFANAWLELLGDRARLMTISDKLVSAAQLHAVYLAQRTGDELLQSMHVGEGGSYSNGRVIAAGYKLSPEYSPLKNNVESCARDAGGPQAALTGLLNSPAHHNHLMGILGFADRTVYAVGQAGNDWVVLACPPEEVSA